MRIDFSVIGFIEFLCYFIIAEFFVRFLASRYSETSFGKALGYLFM